MADRGAAAVPVLDGLKLEIELRGDGVQRPVEMDAGALRAAAGIIGELGFAAHWPALSRASTSVALARIARKLPAPLERCGRPIPMRPVITIFCAMGRLAMRALDAFHDAVGEEIEHRRHAFVGAPEPADREPEGFREPGRGLLRRVALAMGVRGEALQDVGDGNLARAAHHAVIALRAVPHRARGEHLLLHAGADHHEQLARPIVHFAADGAGAGAHAALHAEREPVRAFDVLVDPAREGEVVFAGRRGDRCSSHGLHPLEWVGANRVDRLHV